MVELSPRKTVSRALRLRCMMLGFMVCLLCLPGANTSSFSAVDEQFLFPLFSFPQVPETPYLNGNDPDEQQSDSDDASDSESESETVPATPSTNNFTFTIDSVTPTTTSKKERRRPATTRNSMCHLPWLCPHRYPDCVCAVNRIDTRFDSQNSH